MSIFENLKNDIKKIIKNAGYDEEDILLKESDRKDLGQYQLNDAMKLAKTYHKSPIDIANNIKDELDKDERFINVNVVKPGFINISLSDKYLIEVMNLMNIDLFNNIDKLTDGKIIIDYGGANVAKSLHVGHLRSANIGGALENLAEKLGKEVISDAHLGDFGRPLGLVILEIKKRYPNLEFFNENFNGNFYDIDLPITNSDLEEIYPTASQKAHDDEKYLNEAREITTMLQHHKKGYYELWRRIIDISKKDIRKVYNMINVDFDLYYGESDAVEYLDELTNLINKKNMLIDSQGAKVIDVSSEDDKNEIPPLIYFKGNDSISYETTDLLTLYQRKKEFNPDEIWYVVDKRQSLHFDQIFRASKKIGIVDENVLLEHIGFGTMNGKDGKPFKTRDGGVLSLKELIKLVYDSTYNRLNSNIVDEKERNDIAFKLAIATIKYSDLLPNRLTDYIFDIEKFTSLDGKTAPYVLYTTIRAKSVLGKVEELPNKYVTISTIQEREFIIELLKLSNILNNSYKQKSLNEICEYIYRICSIYNNFYQGNNIINEIDINKRNSFIIYTNLVYKLNKFLLDILDIEIPNKM